MDRMKRLCCLIYLLFSLSTVVLGQSQRNDPGYIKVPSGYLMVLKKGDNFIEKLKELARKEQIPSASFTAIGFVNITFGYFDDEKQEFDPTEFKDVELASMQGSIAWKKEEPSVHAHGVVAGEDFQAYGGHILSGTVGTGSMEITIFVHNQKLERVQDASLGAEVLNLKD